jgi:RNA polymerase sigma-70 factor (ECF subfamily)
MGIAARTTLGTASPALGPPPTAASATPHDSRSTDIPVTEKVPEDFRLLRQLQRGDRSVLDEIIRGHQQAVYGFLRARLLEPADAEDLCQEVFLRCYSGQVKFDRATQLRPWLIGIARNVLREHVRKRQRSREVAWTELCLELDQLSQIDPAEPHAALAHLGGCLESLGQSARQALDLRYGANMRLAQIGERLSRSEGAVKLLVFRARAALKNCLDSRMKRE